jgi:hypothetical protein
MTSAIKVDWFKTILLLFPILFQGILQIPTCLMSQFQYQPTLQSPPPSHIPLTWHSGTEVVTSGLHGEEFSPACLSGVPFPRRLLQRSSQSGEECSSILLEPRCSNLFREKPVFPHVVSFDVIAPQEILLLEKILGYSAHRLAPF